MGKSPSLDQGWTENESAKSLQRPGMERLLKLVDSKGAQGLARIQ
jgi:hypothetical protein